MRPPRRIPPQSLDHGRRRLRRGHHRLPQLRGGPRPRNPCSVSFCLGRKASLSSLAATHIHGMVSIENVTTVQISSYEELRAIIMRGSEQRHLSFVDLAGSERVKKPGSSGNQLKEAQCINKSLSALVDVISALSSDGQHIPYRNHKLTMVMSDSPGGNAKTLMFVNLSLAESNLDETYNSLMYASRARCIVNDPSKNVSTKKVARLKKLVSCWKEQAGKRAEEEELEEIQEERPTTKEKSDGRLSM